MEKMKLETPNLTARNLEKLAKLFPGIVAEGKVNIDLLRSYVGDEVFGNEAYEFTWVGKRDAIAEAGRPIRKTLRPCVGESKNWDTTENLYIEGDNFDVLKLLQESYLSKVKMIYIDPPYNTGNDFIYKDDFKQGREEYNEEAGTYDEEGERLFKNTETNGRFHSDWCSMIYPRLVLARNMLSDDGVIFISIDDNEVAQLRQICDEIFGVSNFQALIAWRRRHNQPNDKSKMIAKVSENILVYSRNASVLSEKKSYFGLPLSEDRIASYTNSDNDPKGRWTSNPWKAATGRGGTTYTIKTPTGNEYTETWYGNAETFGTLIKENRVHWTDGGNGLPRIKIYLKDAQKEGQAAINFFTHERFGSNQEGSAELDSLFETKGMFDNPKPVKLLKALILLVTKKDSIVLDFFSGSATTAHAVMHLNAEDEGNRKFIMVQLPEVCAEGTEAAKAGYKNICEIGKERIRRAGDKIISENADKEGIENLDIGFRVLKLDDSNMNDVYYAAGDYTQDMLTMLESNIKSDRTDMDLLYGCLLDWGLPLSMPHTHEKIDGFTIHTYNDGDLVACFEEHISEEAIREIANRKPLRAVFRDSSFSSSPEKINVFEIFKLLAPNTSVRVI